MMKRTLHISSMIIAALAVAGCDADRIDNQFAGDSAVCFQPAVSPNGGGSQATRAAELSSADSTFSVPLWCEVVDGIGEENGTVTKGEQLNTSGDNQDLADFATKIGGHFYVAAWKGGSNFIPADTEVTCQDGSWTTASQYQWPAASEATFYAYANIPADGATVSCTSDASQSLTYTIPATASSQNDILMGFYHGIGRYDTTLHKGGNADIVFHHPLTAVCFKLKPGAVKGATTVSVKKISIRNVHASGVAQMTSVSAMESDPGDRFDWTPGSGFTTVTLGDGTSDLTIDSDNDYLIGEPFILIPQNLSENPVRFSVVLDIDGTETTLEATRSINAWEAGKTNVYTLEWSNLPKGALPEAFSVSPTKKVYFSKGNLQATYLGESEHYTWSFAENQYDFIGNASGNKRTGSLVSDDIVDLFRWSFTTNCYGIEGDDYSGDFKDWGIAFGTSNGVATDLWRTLSYDEFRYLFWDLKETGDVTRRGLYACGVTVAGHTNCIVLYPDGYTGTKVENGDTESYDTLEEWTAAEKTGAVCLPAAGWRNGNSVYGCNTIVRYWLSDTVEGGYPWTINYDGSKMKFSSNASPAFGYAVRLVTDAN